MRKKISVIFITAFISVLIIDLYVFSGLHWILKSIGSQALAVLLAFTFWLIPFFFIISFIVIMNQYAGSRNKFRYGLTFRLVGLFLLIYLPKIIFFVFLLLQDIITSLSLMAISILRIEDAGINPVYRNGTFNFISEGAFILSAILFLIILYGITFGRFNFRIRRINLSFESLPDIFNGLIIIHISDLHTGSLQGLQQKIMKVINLIRVCP